MLLPRGLMAITDENGQIVGAMRKRRRIPLEEADRRALRFLAAARFNGPEIARYVDARRAERIPRLVLRLGRSGSIRRAPRRPRSPRLARRSAAKPKPPDDPPPSEPPSLEPPCGGDAVKRAWELRVGVHLSVDRLSGRVRGFAPGAARLQDAAELVGARAPRCVGPDDSPRASLGGHRVSLRPSGARLVKPKSVPSRRGAGHVLPWRAS
jgi:hypothetical protein